MGKAQAPPKQAKLGTEAIDYNVIATVVRLGCSTFMGGTALVIWNPRDLRRTAGVQEVEKRW